MKCFYHRSDLDGYCSAAIVKLHYPECELIGVNYQDSIHKLPPGVFFNTNETIFVVDFSFPITEMVTLNSFSDLHWIDHHKTAIENAHELGFLACGGQLLEIGKAACELTWEYLYKGEQKPIPLAVKLLGRYDVWDHQDKQVLPFQWGMRGRENTLPDNVVFWERVFHDEYFVCELVEKGKSFLKFQQIQDKFYIEKMAYEVEFEGYRALVVNKPFSNSQVFDSIYDSDKHDIMIVYGVKQGKFKYTIYCNKDEIDVSIIAKKYGGGGHRGAAGFYFDELLM